jgi:hypothetical protein
MINNELSFAITSYGAHGKKNKTVEETEKIDAEKGAQADEKSCRKKAKEAAFEIRENFEGERTRDC